MTYGVVSKGNGDVFLMEEKHTSLSIGGGQAGQGYPCIVYCKECKYNIGNYICYKNKIKSFYIRPEVDFCSYGERKSK